MLSVCLITKNEEANIRECLESVRFADEIVIVDSGSTDQTLSIASEYTSNISFNPFRHFAEQKNKALSLAQGEWIFLIDADERVSAELASELKSISQQKEKVAYRVKRRTYFLQKLLRFSGTQNDCPIRFFPRASAFYNQPVHEEIITTLPIRALRNQLLHITTRTVKQYHEKLELYTNLEVVTMKRRGRQVTWVDQWIVAAAKFFFLYIVKGGILDGLTGLKFSYLSAYYHWVKCQKFRL